MMVSNCTSHVLFAQSILVLPEKKGEGRERERERERETYILKP